MLIAVLPTFGCQAHVAFTALPATASAGDRLAAYERLRPVSVEEHIVNQTVSTWDGVEKSTRVIKTNVLLADGTLVYFPDDLLPVVGKDSPMAIAARESAKCRMSLLAGSAVAIPTMLTGIGLGISASSWNHDRLVVDPSRPRGCIAIGLTLTGLVASILTGALWGPRMNEAATTAFDAYDASLREALQIGNTREPVPKVSETSPFPPLDPVVELPDLQGYGTDSRLAECGVAQLVL